MDAILFSVNPTMVEIDDALRHLGDHDELYWEVGFAIDRNKFLYPILGYMHICGNQVEYVATIKEIIPFSRQHYEDEELSQNVKPAVWLREWKENLENCRRYPWKNALVITGIAPFSYNTYRFDKFTGGAVRHPPQGYIRVLPPAARAQSVMPSARNKRLVPAERHLEDFAILQLQEIEPGLQLLERQLSSPAGRLDLLCQDGLGCYVVVELKRQQGTDQVVGQILRYMGWVQERYATEKVRGIIVVGKKDATLSYAIKAAPNIQVKEFRLSIE